MERGSAKHGPLRDDVLEDDVRGMLQGNHPTRAQEDLDAEPPADDDPDVLRPDPPEPDKES
ncbi:hypothetical protein [Saccharopolyspora gloriosae]|uniref:hypothetical protein n=1 Tax=Saccharopolyspora gloriosae TaxID=455344 RepID=UPI001FB82322|nr:hypothetical protein [Saccharopolyspora gloriosae]